jgi:hypothetical protein
MLLFLRSLLLRFPDFALDLKTATRLNFETWEVILCENVKSGKEKRRKTVFLAHNRDHMLFFIV